MADKSNDGSYHPRKSKKERVWTNAEMKYLAPVLVEEKKQFVVRLETLALKKASNNQVFEEISKDESHDTLIVSLIVLPVFISDG